MNTIEDVEDQRFTVLMDGEEKECDLLFTYDGGDVDKPIIGYTDNSTNDKGELNIYVSKYDPLYGPSSFEDITDPEELKFVDNIIKQITDSYEQE